MTFFAPVAKYAVWILLGLPALVICYRYFTDAISYGQVIHQTGDISVGLLLCALAVTPLGRVFSTARWLGFFRFHRRAFGVTSFAYAGLHAAAYIDRKWGANLILKEGLEPELATGWLALLIFLVLAVTSNNSSVRKLGRNWKRLHRAVYFATALTFAHWLLTAFDPQTALIWLVMLSLVQALRWLPGRRPHS